MSDNQRFSQPSVSEKVEKYLKEKPERHVLPNKLLEKLVLKKEKGVDVIEEVIDWLINELKTNNQPEPEPEN